MTADLSSPAGVWEGSIDFPGMPMVLMISLIEGADGQWQGVLEAPTGGAAPPVLEDLSVRGRVVSFRAPVGSDTLRVEGVMSADGRFLVGDATRASVTGSLGLRRRAAPAAAP
jgi:hypothetical protein